MVCSWILKSDDVEDIVDEAREMCNRFAARVVLDRLAGQGASVVHIMSILM